MDREPGPPAGVTSSPAFVDGFGARYQTVDPDTGEAGDLVEVLSFSQALVDAPDFATTLGIRVARLAGVRHTLFAHARRLDRPTDDSLLLVSDHVAGWRLANVLDVIEQESLTLDITAILSVMRQLIPTVALFARHQRELAVGTIGPEHLILTPQGRLVLTEYVLGSATEKLSLSRELLWRRFRVASTPGATKIWTRSDVLSIGMVFLSLLHGRRLGDAEFPDALGDLLHQAKESSNGKTRPLSPKLAGWLGRALQLDAHTGFQTPAEAQRAFEELLESERSYSTTTSQLDAFIAKFESLTGEEAIGEEPIERPISPPVEERAPTIEERRPVVVEGPSPSALEELVSSVVAELPPLTPPPPPEPIERRRSASPKPATVPEPVRAPEPIAEQVDVAPRPRFRFDLQDWTSKALAAVALVAVLEFIAIVWLSSGSSDSLAREGELVVQSRPAGATVTLDDKDLGPTPVTVRLSPGTYTLTVRVGTGEPRVIPVQIRAGVQTMQYLELQGGR